MNALEIFLMVSSLVAGPPDHIPRVTEVESIEMVSIRTGRRSLKSELVMVRKGDHFIADHDRFTEGKVTALLEALAPRVKSLDIERLGVTRSWLDTNARKAMKTFNEKTVGNPGRFLESFRNLEKVRETLENYYRVRWKDDYPRFRVVIHLEGERRIQLISTSQHLFMIPWRIENGGSLYDTYNPGIAPAIVGLLPKNFATNRDRLAGSLSALIGRLLVSEDGSAERPVPAGRN